VSRPSFFYKIKRKKITYWRVFANENFPDFRLRFCFVSKKPEPNENPEKIIFVLKRCLHSNRRIKRKLPTCIKNGKGEKQNKKKLFDFRFGKKKNNNKKSN
jgi:hypothetical protein